LKVRHGRSGEGYSTAETPSTLRKSEENQEPEGQRTAPIKSFTLRRLFLIFLGVLGVSAVTTEADARKTAASLPGMGVVAPGGGLKVLKVKDGDDRSLSKFVSLIAQNDMPLP
jgi:hypothetical protein